MLDDFFLRALLAGVGVALVAAPLGCFIVWRRLAYFGDTMAHSALLGIALAALLDLNLILGVFFVAAGVALALVLLSRSEIVPADSLLGILSHSTLALGLVLIAFMTWLRVDLTGLLFGDILAVSRQDLLLIYGGGLAVIAVLIAIWRPLLAGTVNVELAAAEGLAPERARLIFMLLMAAVIATAMKVVGILLITALLIIPAAAARRFATTPEAMAVVAAGLGGLAALMGLFGSLRFDTPSGPSIVVAALAIFLVSLTATQLRRLDKPAEPS
ncbi:metal ABC transporter permease [Algihabitans albus]|uniref:metal ABC transporter permease n=1 Tax=Algihabitans albus TaxID=2164067 RepID=UPI000E5DA2A4|nr:metal ABC transporter permease [Algihabitans albus]